MKKKTVLHIFPLALFLGVLLSVFLLVGCNGNNAQGNDTQGNDSSYVPPPVFTFTETDSTDSMKSSQPPALPSDQSAANPVFAKAYGFLSNLAREEGSLEGDNYSYQFKDGVFIMTDSKDESLTLMEVQYNLKYICTFSMAIPKSLTMPYTFWYQEYEYEDDSNTPVTSASSLINPILYHGSEDISIISDSFYSTNYRDADYVADVMADSASQLLYAFQRYLLLPNGYSIDQLGFAHMLQEIENLDEDETASLSDKDELETSVSSDNDDEDTVWLLDEENFLDVTVDGVEKTFYVGHSQEGGGGTYCFYTYTVPNLKGEYIYIKLSPEMEAGETWTSSEKDTRFYLSYETEGLQKRYTPFSNRDANWEVTMEQITSNGEHMEGSFYAEVSPRSGGRSIEVYGSFCLNFGETVPEAEAIYEETRRTTTSNAGGALPTWSSEDESTSRKRTTIDCTSCHGTKKCTGCGGWGYKDVDGDGVFETKCYDCRGDGICPICHGKGTIII